MTQLYHPPLPTLQLVWDSTALRKLMTCPRYYKLSQLEGWSSKSESLDLQFGIFLQKAIEDYHNMRNAGALHQEALRDCLHTILCDTATPCTEQEYDPWLGQVSAPFTYFGGAYVTRWRCQGLEPYKNEKGNKAKCPYSHKGKWQLGSAPPSCPECGSDTEEANEWLPENATKNRYTLLFAVCAILDHINEGHFRVATLDDGTAIVEANRIFPAGVHTEDGYDFLFSVNLDEVVEFGEELWVLDNKTTGKALGSWYYRQFSPDVQVDLYDIAGNMLLGERGTEGVLIRAIQSTAEGAEIGLMPFRKVDEQREETLRDFQWWIKQAERFARENYWPTQTSHCERCSFNAVCSAPPARRQNILEEHFTKRYWNPLTRDATKEKAQ